MFVECKGLCVSMTTLPHGSLEHSDVTSDGSSGHRNAFMGIEPFDCKCLTRDESKPMRESVIKCRLGPFVLTSPSEGQKETVTL